MAHNRHTRGVQVSFHAGSFFVLFYLLSADFFFQNQLFQKSFRNTIRVSNSLDPDQAQHFVEPGLGPDCLQRLSSKERVKDS